MAGGTTFSGQPWKLPYSKDQLASAVTNQVPIIGDKNKWYRWDIDKMAYVDTGVTAGIPAGAAMLFGPVLVSLPAAGWTGNGPWVQQVAVEGVKADDDQLEVVYTNPDNAAYAAAYQCIGQIESVDGGLVFTCFGQKPVTDIQVNLMGVQ